MNKSGLIKKLSEELGFDEEKCILIESVIGDHFIIGKNNKEKIIKDLIEKVGVSEEVADQIYNKFSQIAATSIKDKILHPFKKD